MKPRSGDKVMCVARLFSGAPDCRVTWFAPKQLGTVTVVKPYVKGEYIYVANDATNEIDTVPLEMFKSHFQIVARKDDEA